MFASLRTGRFHESVVRRPQVAHKGPNNRRIYMLVRLQGTMSFFSNLHESNQNGKLLITKQSLLKCANKCALGGR